MGIEKKRWRSVLEPVLAVALSVILFLSMALLANAEGVLDENVTGQTGSALAWGPPNNPDSVNSNIGALPTTIRADGFSQSIVTARIRDNLNNVVPDQLVGFVETAGCGSVNTAFVEAESVSVTKSASHWATQAQVSSYGGQIIVTDGSINSTAYAEWVFWGEGVSVAMGKGPDGGTVSFELDGVPIGSYSLYNAASIWKVEKIVPVKLTAGAHTIRVRATNVKEVASTGYMIRLDAFRSGVYTLAAPDPNAGNATIPFTSSTTACVATVVATVVRDAATTPWFTMNVNITTQYGVPTSLSLAVNPASIPIGGATALLEATAMDDFSLPVVDGTPICFYTTLGTLSTGQHMEIESGDPSIVFLVPGNWLFATTGVPFYRGAGYLYTNVQNERVTWSFTGNNVCFAYYEYYTDATNSGAQFQVRVDGVQPDGQVDSSPAGAGCGCWKIWSIGNLTPGTHTVEVRKIGASLSEYLIIDYFGVCATVSGGAGKATNVLTSGSIIGSATITASLGYFQRQTPGNFVPTFNDTKTVAITAGPPATLSLTPASTTASCDTNRIFTANVKDAFGNNTSGVTVTFSCDLTGLWSANPVTTDGSGNATSTFKAQQSGNGTVSASVGVISDTSSIVVSPGLPVTISCAPGSLSIYASGVHSTTINVSAQDACGNPIKDGAIVTFTTSLGTLTPNCYTRVQAESSQVISSSWATGSSLVPAPDGGSYAWTGADGAKISWTFIGRVVGFRYARYDQAARLRVWIDGVQVDNITAYSPSYVAPNCQWVYWSSPLLAAGVHTIEVEKRPHGTGLYAIVDYFDTGCITIGGSAQAVLHSTTTIGTANVIAYVEGISCTTHVNFVPGPPTSIAVTPNPVQTDCNRAVTVRAHVRDAWGNDVADGTLVTFSASLPGTWGMNPVPTLAGLAQVPFVGHASGIGTVQATSGSATGSRQLIVNNGPLTSVSVTANPTSIIANGISTSTITITATDICGNCIQDGKIVTFTTSLGTIGAASGRAEVETNPPVVAIGSWTFAAAPAGFSGTGYLYSNVVGDSLRWTFKGTSASVGYYDYAAGGLMDVWVDGVLVSTINTNSAAPDGWMSRVVADGMTFGLHLIEVHVASASYVNVDYFEANITTKSCKAITTLTSVATLGTATVTGYLEGLSDTAAVSFVPGPAYTINVMPNPVNATCGANVTVHARPRDQWGNDLPVGTLVTFSSTLGGSFSPNPAATDGTGRATTQYTGHTAGAGTITAAIGAVSGSTTLNTTAGSAAALHITYSPHSIHANGTSTSVITATVTDACGNGIPGVLVTFVTNLGSITPNDTSDANGVVNATLTSGVLPGIATVTITAGAISDNSTRVYFVGQPTFVTLSPSVSEIGVSGCFTPTCVTLIASVTDGNGYPAADGESVLFVTSLGVLDSNPCVKFTHNGQATATLCSTNIAGTAVITSYVSIPGPDIYATTSVTIKSCDLFAFSFDVIGMPQFTGAPFNVVVRAKDQYGNQVTGYVGPATLTSMPGGVVSPTSIGPFVNGLWSGNVTISAPGWTALQVCDGLICAWSNVFQVLPGTPTATPTATSTGAAPPTATPTATATSTGVAPTPTATATIPPSSASILGQVQLQGRPAPPDPSWMVSLTVTVGPNVYMVTTDQSGAFVINGVPTGVQAITVKNPHTLSNRKLSVAILPGLNLVNMGVLKEGDANNDDVVDISDFSILRTVFGTTNPQADFNQDGVVDISDFSLLRTNFGQAGPIIIVEMEKSSEALRGFTAPAEKIAAAEMAAASTVSVYISPTLSIVNVGDTFTLTIVVDSGAQQLDAAQVYLNFDTALLEVISLTGGGAFSLEFQKTFDNTAGTIDYAAFTLFGLLPSGKFNLATVQIRGEAPTAGAPVTLNLTSPRKTKATFSGQEMLLDITDGAVIIMGAESATATPTTSATPTATVQAQPTRTPTATATTTAANTPTATATTPATQGEVTMVLSPSSRTVATGSMFAIDVVINAGAQMVDLAQAFIDFDPTYLKVVDDLGNPTNQIIPHSSLPLVTINSVDNALGRINYAAALVTSTPPSGTFTLATIRFKAYAPTLITPLTFHMALPRECRVSRAGVPLLSGLLNGLISIVGEAEATPTGTATVTLTPTGTATATLTPVGTATATLTPIATATATLTLQPQASATWTATPISQPGTVSLVIQPAPYVTTIGQIFTLDIVVSAGAQSVDAVQAYLNFDPAYLMIVDGVGNSTNQIIPGSGLPLVASNVVNNSLGTINYVAGLSSMPPSGTFVLATLRFRALACTWNTPVSFSSTAPRQTQAIFGGVPVLGSLSNGAVLILCDAGATPTVTPTTPTQPTATATPTSVIPTSTATPTATPQSGTVALWIQPTTKVTQVGQIFQLDVVVDAGAQAVDWARACISFDPAYLKIVDALGNPTNQLMPGSALPRVLSNLADNASGKIYYNADRPVGGPVSGSFVLATLRLKALSPNWNTPVAFCFDAARESQVRLAGANLLGAVHDGVVMILTQDGALTPTPTALATVTPTAVPTATPTATHPPQPTATATVTPVQRLVRMLILPPNQMVNQGDFFTLDIIVQTAGQRVDAAQAYLNFDPTVLQVVDGAGNPASAIIPQLAGLPDVLQNTVNNGAGMINYAAGVLVGTPPDTTFTLARIRFKALSQSGGSPVVFDLLDPRRSDASYNGSAVLGGTEYAMIVIVGAGSPTVQPTPTALPTGTLISTATLTGTATTTQTPTATATSLLPTVTPTASSTPIPVNIAIRPANNIVPLGSVFEVDIMVEAGAQPVDRVEAFLQFDVTFLNVVDVVGNPSSVLQPGVMLPSVSQNVVGNTAGLINFVASTAGVPPVGNWKLATIRLKALAPTGGTYVRFNFVPSRTTRVLSVGADVLGSYVHGLVAVAADQQPGGPTASPTATLIETPTGTPTETATPIATAWPTATTTPTATATPTATLTATRSTPTATMTATATPEPGSVTILVEPVAKVVTQGQVFTLDIMIDSGAQEVDGAQAYLDFDPALLEVVDDAGNPANQIIPCSHLSTLLANVADNAAGQISFAAGSLIGTPPSGRFCLGTIRFRAKAGSLGTALTFSFLSPRVTTVTREFVSILTSHVNGVLVIQGAPPAPSGTPTGTPTRTPTVTPTPTATHALGVEVAVEPAFRNVQPDQIFTLDVVIRAGDQPVDGAQAYLDFDPTNLLVVDEGGDPTNQIIAGHALDLLIQNVADNDAGQINFAAGKIGGPFPTGTFVLATIRFKALGTSAGSWITFHRSAPRDTKVVFTSHLLLEQITDGVVVIAEQPPTPTPTATATPRVYGVGLPLILR